ncbi:NADPH-dependent F420 reductase [Poseidonocella sp. HB161398]|uniref:NADPH-dependent F420 reductase n=1 Tax=Poseidonocella sp. HB161398 TaxID=2320855 RepID=UPI00110907E1|nr:NAD(P)-binding domain-containing protein [Poseidonocella sp. HB161398]
MKIGIIGAGAIAQAVAKLGREAGHEVMLSNSRGGPTLAEAAAATGARAGSAAEAAAFGELVLVAIPLHRIADLPAGLLAGKTVIDANNYYPERDGRIAALEEGRITTSALVASHLDGAQVVKAFNAILARELNGAGTRLPGGAQRALPVAGDHPSAKAAVIRLMVEFGFGAVDAGPLSESWRFERARPVYCVPLAEEPLREGLAATTRDSWVPEGSWR